MHNTSQHRNPRLIRYRMGKHDAQHRPTYLEVLGLAAIARGKLMHDTGQHRNSRLLAGIARGKHMHDTGQHRNSRLLAGIAWGKLKQDIDSPT